MNQTVMEGSRVEGALWLGAPFVERAPVDEATSPPVLVVGCSEEVPNEVRAFHLIGAHENGGAALSRHDGVAYTGTLAELSSYRETLARMVDSVMAQMPPGLRSRGRRALIKRWNRDWGVTALGASCVSCEAESRAAEVFADRPPARAECPS